MLFAVSASAQQPAADASDKNQPEAAQLLSMAGQLVQYGYQTKAALPLIQAVQIYQKVGVRPEEEAKTKTSDTAVTGDDQKAEGISYDQAKLLADAKTFAGSDKNLQALIKECENAQTRGAVGGAITHRDRVLAGCTDSYTIRFRGGEVAYIVVNGDHDTDLDLYVYDENGNFIVADTDRTDICTVSFTPRWTGVFYVKIKNLGRVSNYYTLYTN